MPKEITEELIKKIARQSNEVSEGLLYEDSISMFTEAKTKKELENSSSFKSFTKSVVSKISDKDKSDELRKFINYPLTAVNKTDSMLKELYRVFEASNSIFEVSTRMASKSSTINDIEGLNIRRYIEEETKKVLKNSPNLICVVDRNEEGEEYVISIPNSRLLTVDIDKDEYTILSLSFIHTPENGDKVTKIAYYDEEKYTVISVKDGKEFKGEGYERKEVEHGLGYCPACFFVQTPVVQNGYRRLVPFTTVLSKLNEWQEFDIYKYFSEHTIPFPFVVMVKPSCDNDNCENGTITNITYGADNGEIQNTEECQSCKSVSLSLGSVVEYEVTADGEIPQDIFRTVSFSSEGIKYLQDKLYKIDEDVKSSVVGVEKNTSREAMNKEQVSSLYESRTNVLLSIKNNMDRVHRFIVNCIYSLRGGNVENLEMSIDYGTEWYLITEDELQERFNKAKESGLPITEIDSIYNQLISTKYKNNPNKAKRLLFINSLDPLRYSSSEEKQKKREAGIVSLEELITSERILYLVEDLERIEGMSILELGVKQTEQEKYLQVKNIIEKKVKDLIKNNNSYEQTQGE